MASKFSELNDKVDQKLQEVVDKVTGKGGDGEESEEDSKQEYYEPRRDDQIVDGGKLVLSKEQVEEAEQDRGGPASSRPESDGPDSADSGSAESGSAGH